MHDAHTTPPAEHGLRPKYSTDDAYKYDLYISYGRADWSWAEKLFTDLEKLGLEPFIDKVRLKSGKQWEPQLKEALSTSQHMVVLWSKNAEQSSWVRREIGYLEGQESSDRLLIFLVLEREPTAYSSLHWITELRDQEAYSAGADHIDPNVWRNIVDTVGDVINLGHDSAIPVPLAILTITEGELNQLNSTQTPLFAQRSLNDYLNSIGIESKDKLQPFYGPQRKNWRPFGSDEDIWTTLLDLKDEVNASLQMTPFRWELLGDAFWSNDYSAFRREALKLKAKRLSVVIVDPIALYYEEVRERFNRLSEELRNVRVLFLTLLPWTCWGIHLSVREQMELMATPVFRHLYEPSSRNDTTKTPWICDVNIGDGMDIKRALLPALGEHLVEQPTPEVLRHPRS